MFFSLPQILGLVPRTFCTPPDSSEGLDGGSAAPVRQVECTRNAGQWHHIAEFLQDQQLESLGLRRSKSGAGARADGKRSAAAGAAGVSNLPDGNHGDNSFRTVSEVA